MPLWSLLYIPWFRLDAWRVPVPLLEKLPIQPFGLLVAMGIIFGSKLAEWKAKRSGVSPDIIPTAVMYVVGVGFLGAHAFDLMFYHPHRVLEDPLVIVRIWDGISSFGGFFGAVAGAFLYRRRHQMPILVAIDPIAFGFPLGFVFGRLGCFVVHDHPGKVTTFPLAVADYPVGDPPYMPRHDLGLYEMLWSVAVTLLFFVLVRKTRKHGFYLALLPILYAPVRFFLDYLRETPTSGGDVRYLGLTPGQYSALVFLVIGVVLARWLAHNPNSTVPAHAVASDARGETPLVQKPQTRASTKPAKKKKR
jgi:phosphatidylglycerol:prolipoprotein diacylglycerol transferase